METSMSLQEIHQTFFRTIETGEVGAEYYKPFAWSPAACTNSVRLMDLGYKDASQGRVVSDFINNLHRKCRGVSRWGGLQYVLDGQMIFNDFSGAHVVKSGEAVLFSTLSETSYHDPENPDAKWLFFTFCGNVAMGVLDEVVAKNGYILHGLEHSRLIPLVAHLFSMALSHAAPHQFAFSAQLYLILMEVAGEILSYRNTYPEPVAHALEIIDHNFNNAELSLETLSIRVGLSKYHFARMFKEHMGESLGEYILQKRMQTAMDLLLRTSQPVKEIQYICGFNNYSYFLTVFRKFHGMPPGAVRLR